MAKMAKCPAYQVPVIVKGRAKVAKWQDIPNWGKRKDCPLLDMLPMEVLDKCFNPEHGLKVGWKAVTSPDQRKRLIVLDA